MTDLNTRKINFSDLGVQMNFVVNEFPLIQVPPKQVTVSREFHEMSLPQRQKLVERLIVRVKEL